LISPDILNTVQFDALGAYSAPGNTNSGEPYPKLVEVNRWYWNQFRATGREVVPLVNTGWDGRPRGYSGAWYENAKAIEVANPVRAALDWNQANPNSARAQTVMIYAWNEYDEGGWLCPTKAEGEARLKELKRMLAAYP